jgi:hypothetical protein
MRTGWTRQFPALTIAAATSTLALFGTSMVSPSARAGDRADAAVTTPTVGVPRSSLSAPTPSRVAPTTSAPVSTTLSPTTVPPPRALAPSTAPPTTAPTPIPVSVAPCAPAAVPGGAFALGDSVMIDAESALVQCVANIEVNAAVSRQWSDGETVMRQVMARAARPAVVVVDLGTNGPITDADFDTMMQILASVTRVVFVTVHVDQSWQDQVNGVLARGVLRYPTAVLADWWAVSSAHPEWFYADGTHMPIDGPGAQALADLIAARV